VSSRRKAYAVIAGVFVLGVLAGGGAMWAISERRVRAFAMGERRAFETRRLEALSRELDLTSEQKEKIAAIFEKHHQERKTVMRERCGGAMAEVKEKLRTEIHAVLTPPQREKYDAMVREHEARKEGARGQR
jgi:Spy/CpxP family protein refolding chaperone